MKTEGGESRKLVLQLRSVHPESGRAAGRWGGRETGGSRNPIKAADRVKEAALPAVRKL